MKKGEIWLVDIPHSDGHEQHGKRPLIIFVELEAHIVLSIPCTSNMKALRFPHVLEIAPNKSNGLTENTIALIFQLRAIDKKRLIKKIGNLDDKQIKDIENFIKKMLNLN